MAKVFDFTNGTKGDFLGTTRTGWAGSALVEKDGKVFKVEIASNPFGSSNDSVWDWHSAAGWTDRKTGEDHEIDPESFGVCFSLGEWNGQDTATGNAWIWTVLGTRAWNREACKKGILKSTRHQQ